MHKKIKLFTKKSISLILALAVLLTSVVSTISVFAAETPYEVSFRAPAIPMDAMTVLDLADIKVQLQENGTYYAGDELIWFATTTDASKFVLNESAGTITAYQRGVYSLMAQSTDGKQKMIYLSVKQKDEKAFPIYEKTFDNYTELNNVDIDVYTTGGYTWPAYPNGWKGQIIKNTYTANPPYVELPGLAPYSTTALYSSTDKYYAAQTEGPGVVPFNNNKGDARAQYAWLGFGFFTLTDSVVSDFYDYTINSTYKAYQNGESSRYKYGNGLFGRATTADGLLTKTGVTEFKVIHANPYNSTVNLVDYMHNGKNSSSVWTVEDTLVNSFDGDSTADTWGYMTGKNADFFSKSNQPIINTSVRYEGTTATLFSNEDGENKEFSYTVADGKGSVGMAVSHVGAGSNALPSWVNIQTFNVYLNNAPDDKPAAEELEIFNVSYDYPAILMNEDTKVDLASLAVQLTENGDYVLGTQINWSVDAANNAVVLNNTKKFVAVTEAGTYPIRATYGDDTKIFWLVAKKANETEFCLVNENYEQGDAGNSWSVFVTTGSANPFEKSDKTITDYGSYLGMHSPSGSYILYLHNEPSLMEFADYTVQMDAKTGSPDKGASPGDGFWCQIGLVARSNADATEHFTTISRPGYGINFMNSGLPVNSLLTATPTPSVSGYIHYHHFHTLSSATERAKLYPVSQGGTGEYSDFADTDRDVYAAKYFGGNIQYSINGNIIFDSTSSVFYDEWGQYNNLSTQPSLSNTNNISNTNWWTNNSSKFTTNAGYAGLFVGSATKLDLYSFKVILPTTTMAPASPYDATQDKVEMYVDESFDANNIVLRFGVVSDVHISGGWHQEESSAKWTHALKTFQQIAKDENSKLDAVLVAGDMVDAFAGTSNVGSVTAYGTKAYQNWTEAKNLFGAVHGTYGEGLDKGTQLFYSLGNHDESGMGWARLEYKGYNDVHTAAYYLATLCGWQYAYKDVPGKDLDINDNVDNSYMDYADTLIAYHNDKTTDVSNFEDTYGIAFDKAYELFLEYFGRDTDLDEVDGLLSGNRHMEMNGYHFLAVELTQSEASCAWADEILAKITAEDPDKPVFIITHFKLPSETMPGLEVDAAAPPDNLQAVVKKYPQVIIWGGHSHSYLHNGSAIDTANGYTQVESSTTEYVAQGDLSYSEATKHSGIQQMVDNLISQHQHAYSAGTYVEVDKDNNVRIRRIDLHQSYSNDYKSDELFTTGEKLYGSNIYTKYGTGVYDYKWSDTFAEIRTPWIISTETRSTTESLKRYTEAKLYNNNAPEFATDKSLTVVGSVGAVNVSFIMNAEDDGMVHNYTLKLYKGDSNEVIDSRQYTNYFYNYANSVAGDIPVISQSVNFTGLEKGVTYRVELTAMDDYGVSGEPLVKSATTVWGKETKVLEDGRVAVFLDTTKSSYVYTDEEGSYLTMSSVDIALGYNPDIIYFIEGIINRNQVVDYTNGVEIIGVNADRSKTLFSLAHLTEGNWPYNTKVLKGDLTLKNITIDVPGTSEGKSQSAYTSAFFYGNSDFVMDDVTVIPDASGNGIQLSAVKNEKVTPGSITIKGDTGPIYRFGFSAFNYWGKGNNYVDGDMTVNIAGGTFNEHVGFTGYDTYSSINGNLFLNISGGTFTSKVSMLGGKTAKSANTNAVMKNAVARISGGTFNANTGYGETGAVYIEGREVIIIANNMLTNDTSLKNGKPLTLTSSDTVLIKADSVDYIGEPTYDANGIITAFAVVQRQGYDSYVNGVAATSIAVTAGGNYTVTYTENGKAGLLGSAAHADAITNNKADFVLSDDIAYYEKYSVTLSDANWVINPSSDYAYANGVLVPLKTGTITVSGTYNGVAFSSDITVKAFDAARNNIVNNSKLSIVRDGSGYILKVSGQMRYDTLTVNGKPMTYLDEVIDGEIKSGTQYILAGITDLTTLSITAKFEYDNADVTGVVYALGATIPTDREDISLRFVNRAPGIKKTESAITLGSAITKGGVEFTAVDIGALVIPEVLLDGSELKLKNAADYKSGNTVELANGQFAKNVVISVLNDTTAKYSDYSVLLTGMSYNVEDIKNLKIALVSYIVYADADGNLHIEYTGEISRSYNDVSDAAEEGGLQSVNLSANDADIPDNKKLIAELKKATFKV